MNTESEKIPLHCREISLNVTITVNEDRSYGLSFKPSSESGLAALLISRNYLKILSDAYNKMTKKTRVQKDFYKRITSADYTLKQLFDEQLHIVLEHWNKSAKEENPTLEVVR